MVDPAFRRPGRFDREIFIGLPNEESRISILKTITQHWPCKIPTKLIELVAKATKGFSGASLKVIISRVLVN